MKIVVTYRHQGNNEYLALIEMAFASAKRLGYYTVMVGNSSCGADIHINFPADSEEYLMNWIVAAQLNYLESPIFNCDSVFFSPDAIIIKDLKPIFDGFDVAFTDRANKKWPINNGVIFVGNTDNKSGVIEFWQKALAKCKSYDIETQKWYGDQKCLSDLLLEPQNINSKLLPCSIYNASPPADDVIHSDFLKSPYVIHFKGKRKSQMKRYFEAIK